MHKGSAMKMRKLTPAKANDLAPEAMPEIQFAASLDQLSFGIDACLWKQDPQPNEVLDALLAAMQ
jgi:hypothetical protein